MKPICIMSVLVLIVSCSCRTTAPADQKTASSSSTDNSSKVGSQDPEWPFPDWQVDPTITVEKGTETVFKGENLTDLTLKMPADWEKIVNRPSLLMYKSPTVDSRFANLIIQSSNTRPTQGILPNPKKDFDYSGYEPRAALKDYLEKKTANPGSGRVQELAIDGVLGVLEQVVYEQAANANSSQKPPEGVWQWTTFMKNKSENNKVSIGVAYPLSERDKFTQQIAALVNAMKIKRAEGVVMIETDNSQEPR